MKKFELAIGLLVVLLALPLLTAPITITQHMAHRDASGEQEKVMRVNEYGCREWIAKGILVMLLLGGVCLFCDACQRIISSRKTGANSTFPPTSTREDADGHG